MAEQTSVTWRPVVGYEGIYEVSDQGTVRSVDRVGFDRVRSVTKRYRGRALRPSRNRRNGYWYVALHRDYQQHTKAIHRIVLEAFAGPCPAGMEALHGDDDPNNNTAANLRWGTRAENVQDAIENGGHNRFQKSENPRATRWAA